MSIGERIRQARKARALSQRSLAEQVGVSGMAISKYERDEDVPGSRVLLDLARALEVNVDFFLRPTSATVEPQAYRKHTALRKKQEEAIRMRMQDWVERYLEVEGLFPDQEIAAVLPHYAVDSFGAIEQAALELRERWNLGLDPIDNLIALLEDRGIKVGLVSGFDDFDSCTFQVDGSPLIVTKDGLPGDRQRFNVAHELGHLVLEIGGGLNPEKAAHRFAGALLVPAEKATFELGIRRTALGIAELQSLKQKYGMSMQAWIYRAKDLEIISEGTATGLFRQFRAMGRNREEPWDAYPPERPMRMERLVYRALAEDMISRSKAQELLGEPLQQPSRGEAPQPDELATGLGR
jgi:transcriptional regulator with XRE-family HTH domain